MRIKLSLLKSFVSRAIEESYDKDKEKLREVEFFKLLRRYISEEKMKQGVGVAKSSRLKIFRSDMLSILDKNINEMIEDHEKKKIKGVEEEDITLKLVNYLKDLMSIFESSEFRKNVRKTNPDFSDTDFESVALKVQKEFYNILRHSYTKSKF